MEVITLHNHMDKPHNYNVEKKEQDPGEHTTYVKFINKVADSFVLVLRCLPLEKKMKRLGLKKTNTLILAMFCLDLVMAL